MPKPTNNAKRRTRTVNTKSGPKIKQSTDTERTSSNRRTIERREAERVSKQRDQYSKIDRERRETDTGHSKRAAANRKARAKANAEYYSKTASNRERLTDTGDSKRKAQARKNRIKRQFDPSTSQKINQYEDNHSNRSAKKNYGNRESTKRAMNEKYGNSRNRASAYDRADYKGKEIERKVKQKYKPSNVSSVRPDESGTRERANHKYIDKVRTKSGKIRYIYNVDGGGSSNKDANTTMRQNRNSKSSSHMNYNKSNARKAVSRLLGRFFG